MNDDRAYKCKECSELAVLEHLTGEIYIVSCEPCNIHELLDEESLEELEHFDLRFYLTFAEA